MNFCAAASSMFRAFGGRTAPRVESLRRDTAPGLQPGVVRRVMKWKPVPKVKSKRTSNWHPSPATDVADLCRQARRLRATFGHDPVRMHQQLKLLTVEAKPSQPQVGPDRSTRFGREDLAHAPAATERSAAAGWEEPEDAFPRYTLLDPEDAPVDDEDDFDFLPADRAFRRLVERTVIDCGSSSMLRYSQRLGLLKEAKRRGIERFEANLTIASVENDAREAQPAAESARKPRISAWMVFVAAQSFITAGFWRLVRG